MTDLFDVAVVGGGPAGAAVAILLAQESCRTALLHVEPPSPLPPIGETLSAAASVELRRLGVWNQFQNGNHRPVYSRTSAWGDAEPAEQSSMTNPHGPGWLIDRPSFHAMLRKRAVAVGAELVPASVRHLRRSDVGPGWFLELDRGALLHSRTIVDATGRGAWVLRRAGGSVAVHDRLAALITSSRTGAELAAPPVMVEATPHGWWYTAVTPSGELVSILFTDESARDCDHLRSLWAASLSHAPETAARLRTAHETSDPRSRPVTVQRGTSSPESGVVAVGDAALGLDPLSASGLCSGLDSARQAADALGAALDGDRTAAARYDDWVRVQFAAHLAEREMFYAMETRWPNAPFWNQRTAWAPTISGSQSLTVGGT